jgi:hypothetical protein
MSPSAGPALEQALACHRAPALLSAAQSRPLPDSLLTLLRLAAGDRALAAQCALASGESEAEVAAAAAFFIRQVLFAPGADSYRVLGVNPDAPDDRIKEHYRWLVRWLHPDRDIDDWDSVYADRVNVAWQTLRLPDRRRSYDASRAAGLAPGATAAAARDRPLRNLPGRHDAPEPAMLSPGTVQKLPVIVLGGLGVAAVVLFSLMWLEQSERTGRAGPVAGVPASMARTWADDADPVEVTFAPEVMPSVADPVAPAPQATAAVDRAVSEGPAAVAMPRSNANAVAGAADESAAAESSAPGAGGSARPARMAIAATEPEPVALAAAAVVAPAAAPATPAASAPAAATPMAPVAAEPLPLQEAQAHAVLRSFSQAYEAGDIRTLMQLFTRDARNNRGGREAIAYDYQSLFSASDTRELRLVPHGWMARAEGGTVLARYEARVVTGGGRGPEVSQGEIRFDLRVEEGRARISRVTHD